MIRAWFKRHLVVSSLPRFAWGIGFVFGRDRAHGPAIGFCLLGRQVHLYWRAQ